MPRRDGGSRPPRRPNAAAVGVAVVGVADGARMRACDGCREHAAPAETAAPDVGDAEAAETHVEGVPEHAEAVARTNLGAASSRSSRRAPASARRADGEMPPHAEPGADQPDLPPVYTGPTPANPFGGHTFDIFDVLDRVEATAATPVPVGAVEPEPVVEPERELASAVMAEPVVEPEPKLASAVMAEALSAQAGASDAEPVAEPVAIAKDESEPLIKPIVIGDGAPVAERKRGWWRR